jgi:hypothetical protein
MALEKEMETYKVKLPELREHEGKFALVHEDKIDVFGTYEDALNEGYRRYKLTPFLVRKIEAAETVQFISRYFAACHT